MVCAFVNCAVVLKNASISSFFNGQRWTKCAVNILRSYQNLWHNWQLKSSRRSHTLKGSYSMGDGWIFLKTRRDVSFNKVLSNEPNFGRIHLTGQYLYSCFSSSLCSCFNYICFSCFFYLTASVHFLLHGFRWKMRWFLIDCEVKSQNYILIA